MNNTFKTLTITTTILLATISGIVITPTTVSAQPDTKIIAQKLIANGSFVTVEQNHPTSGNARIITENGKRYLEFTEDFTTVTGPDVRVILHRNSSIPVNVKEENYINLAALKNVKGTQRYELPQNVNLNEFKSVGIWCRKFNVTFGYVRLALKAS
ncbi:electron transfer flavoprotein [Hydrocoleum sp. CS-953]|nr:electron transfer flavoprotein [Hydrocoleum sp. CS-953]